MKNDFPVMPIRAMYADKSTKGKDLNKIGNIEPITIPNNLFDRPTLEKAIEAGAFIYDGFTYYISHVTRNGDGVDMYASAAFDDEFITRVVDVYTDDDPNTVTVDTFSKFIPTEKELYRHNIELNLGQNGNVYCSFVSLHSAVITTLVDIFYWYGDNPLPATGVYINSNSQAFPIVRISRNPSNSRLQVSYVATDNLYTVNISSQTITDTVVALR